MPTQSDEAPMQDQHWKGFVTGVGLGCLVWVGVAVMLARWLWTTR